MLNNHNQLDRLDLNQDTAAVLLATGSLIEFDGAIGAVHETSLARGV